MLQAIQRAQAGIVARAAWGQAALQTNRWFTGSCAVQSDQPSAAPKVPRVPPGLVDLDTELDRDDPLLADKSHLWDTPKPPPYVDLETELDHDDLWMADKSHLWDTPKPPPYVDLETELDHDDPEMADKSHLWDTPKSPPYVDTHAEMDLMDDPTDVPVRKGARKA